MLKRMLYASSSYSAAFSATSLNTSPKRAKVTNQLFGAEEQNKLSKQSIIQRIYQKLPALLPLRETLDTATSSVNISETSEKPMTPNNDKSIIEDDNFFLTDIDNSVLVTNEPNSDVEQLVNEIPVGEVCHQMDSVIALALSSDVMTASSVADCFVLEEASPQSNNQRFYLDFSSEDHEQWIERRRQQYNPTYFESVQWTHLDQVASAVEHCEAHFGGCQLSMLIMASFIFTKNPPTFCIRHCLSRKMLRLKLVRKSIKELANAFGISGKPRDLWGLIVDDLENVDDFKKACELMWYNDDLFDEVDEELLRICKRLVVKKWRMQRSQSRVLFRARNKATRERFSREIETVSM